MGEKVTVTIALEKSDQKLAQELAYKKYGSVKGSLSKVFSEGLHFVQTEFERQQAREKLLKLMERGFNLGFKGWKDRGELYDRN